MVPFEVDEEALSVGYEQMCEEMAPEFAEFLLAIPEAERIGPVFHLKRRRKRYTGEIRLIHVSKIISSIGHKAGVKVNHDTGKCTSTHDLRRAFGQRWAAESCRRFSCS